MKNSPLELAEAAMQKVAVNVRRLHQQSGHPMVIWQDGKVIAGPPQSTKIAKRGSSVGLKKK